MRPLLLSLLALLASAPRAPRRRSTSRPPDAAADVLLRGGTVHTVTNGTLENTDVLVRDGKIARIGQGLTAPTGVRRSSTPPADT